MEGGVDRMRLNRVVGIGVLFAICGSACAPSSPSSGSQAAGGSSEASGQTPKTLVAAIRIEPAFIASKPLRQAGLTLGSTVRLFGASLAISDDRGRPRPYLAETLPEL